MLKIRSQTIALLFLAVAVAVGGALMKPKNEEMTYANTTFTLNATNSGDVCSEANFGTGTTWVAGSKTCTMGSGTVTDSIDSNWLEITGNGVTVDCNAKIITLSASSGYPYAIYAHANNVTVKNCVLNGFVPQILVSGNNNVIRDNTLSVGGGKAGVNLSSGTNNAVVNNIITSSDPAGSLGIGNFEFSTSNGSYIIGNSITGVGLGISLQNGGQSFVYANTITLSGTVTSAKGIELLSATNSEVRGNSIIHNASGSGGTGIDLQAGTGNTIKANRVRSMPSPYTYVYTTGINLGTTASPANIIASNIVTNSTTGIVAVSSYATSTSSINNTCASRTNWVDNGQPACTWASPTLIAVCNGVAPITNAVLSAALSCTTGVNAVTLGAASDITFSCDGYSIGNTYSNASYHGVSGSSSSSYTGQAVVGCNISTATSGIHLYYGGSAFGNTITLSGTANTDGITSDFPGYSSISSIIAGNTILAGNTYPNLGILSVDSTNSGGKVLGNNIQDFIFSVMGYSAMSLGQRSQVVRYNRLIGNYTGMYLHGTSGVDYLSDFSYNIIDGASSSSRVYGIYFNTANLLEGSTFSWNVIKNYTSYGIYNNSTSINDNILINNVIVGPASPTATYCDIYDAGFNFANYQGGNNTCNRVHVTNFWKDAGQVMGCTNYTVPTPPPPPPPPPRGGGGGGGLGGKKR